MMIWNKEETKILKQLLDKKIEINEILKVFPYRTKDSIENRARRLGYKQTPVNVPIDYEIFKTLIGEQITCP
jgi:hypothetical protein